MSMTRSIPHFAALSARKHHLAARCSTLVAFISVTAACTSNTEEKKAETTSAVASSSVASSSVVSSSVASSSDGPVMTSVPPRISPDSAASGPTTTARTDAIPESIRGKWRENYEGVVAPDDCRQDGGFERNFGKVLEVDANGFRYFESGGTLINVIERDTSRIDAVFDTTYADTPTQARIVFDAQDDNTVLIVRDDRPGPIRFVRCPTAP
jgi:hypothetical protein